MVIEGFIPFQGIDKDTFHKIAFLLFQEATRNAFDGNPRW
jgi:hypothetical protein